MMPNAFGFSTSKIKVTAKGTLFPQDFTLKRTCMPLQTWPVCLLACFLGV